MICGLWLVVVTAHPTSDSRNFPTLYPKCKTQALSERGQFHLFQCLKVWEGFTMRYLLVFLIALSFGCSKTVIADTHKQEDYEWKDSTAVVKSKFPGQLAELKKEEAVHYLVGTTEVDGLPYGVTFVFLKNQLVSIFLSAQSQSDGEWTPTNMEANRRADWSSDEEYSDLKSKLTAKYGEGEQTNDDIGSIKWNLPNDFLSLWSAEDIVGIQYSIPYETELGKEFNEAIQQEQ